jgi:hypothetical protein
MLKKASSFVLASLRGSTYRKGTPAPSLAAAALATFLNILRDRFGRNPDHHGINRLKTF